MSDTPRTDAAIVVEGNVAQFVHADFARELELELANAKSDAESYRRTANQLAERVASLEQQLEEAERMEGK